ncbi:MAG: pilus assembly PilX N-terminal domain-containing protein [Burkholderiaceae bacterium]|nr:pilus assembly PilX N-terminal domain-containing protein [Burkholderiaceae bacterium]
MPKPSVTPRRGSQQGLAALTVVMLLMLGATIGVVYLNRGVIFEQKIAANQVRSKVALEMADAGIDWATGMLNAQSKITTTCKLPDAAGLADPNTKSFRNKYITTLLYGSTAPMQPAANTLPGCKLSLVKQPDGSYKHEFNCSCPDVSPTDTRLPNFSSVANPEAPGFTVQFSPLSADQDPTGNAVRIISTGCAAKSGACIPGEKGVADATATASVILRLQPSVVYKPSVPLTCGVACVLLNLDLLSGKKLRVVNQDPGTGGMLVNAGLLSIPGMSNILGLNALTSTLSTLQTLTNNLLGLNLFAEMITLPGKSPNNVTAAPDANLLGQGLADTLLSQSGLLGTLTNVLGGASNTVTDLLNFNNVGVNLLQCDRSGVFKMYFGTDIATFADPLRTPSTKSLPECGGTSAACGKAVKDAYAEGWRSFYFPNGVSLDAGSGLANNTLGTEDDPVTLVTPKKLNLGGGVTVNGLLFSNSGVAADVSLGNSNIHGALISCSIYANTGSGDIVYSSTAINRLGITGKLYRVPGSWTDRCVLRALARKPNDSVSLQSCPGDPS